MLCNFISPSDIKINLESTEKEECIAELLEVIIADHPSVNRKEALSALFSREDVGGTDILPGVAIPHAVCNSVKKSAIALGISKRGIDFDSNVKIVFEILFEPGNAEFHMLVLKDIVNLIQDSSFINRLVNAKSSQDVFDIIEELETQTL